MKSRYIKILISVVLIVSLCFAIYTSTANAIEAPIVIGGAAIALGGLAWAISNAMGVSFDLQNYTSQTVDSFIDPYYQIQQTLTTSDFTFVKAFRLGYDALQLSLSAYNAIKSGAENLITGSNIQDNTSGTIPGITTDGYDTKLGILQHATVQHAIGATWTYNFGRYTFVLNDQNQYGYTTCKFYVAGTQYGQDATYISTSAPQDLYFKIGASGNTAYLQVGKTPDGLALQSSPFTISRTTTQALPYESEIVDTSFADNALQNVTVIIPQQGSLTAASPLDDILAAINELALDNNPAVSVEVDVAPAPTPTPLPTDALGDIPFNTFMEYYGESVFQKIDEQTTVVDTFGQSALEKLDDNNEALDTIGQAIDNQTDVIDTYGQSVIEVLEDQTEVIDTVGQDVVDAVDAVDTNIQTGNGILSGIRSLVGSAVDTLEDIGEMVGELVEDIVLGTETLISGILNQIPSLFNVILSPIKTAASIWHYVVEWIQSIASPFQFIWSMANGTSYYIVLPVYASLAAAVVLAFYKRFGK